MTYAIYEDANGKRMKYTCREVVVGHFTRFGIFDNRGTEIQPEQRNERFIRYEVERDDD